MTVEVIKHYYCDICGQLFDNSSSCINHEHTEALLNKCRFWDDNMDELFDSEPVRINESGSEEVYYIYIPDEPGCYEAVKEWLESHGAVQLPDDNQGENYGIYVWHDGEREWVNLRNIIRWTGIVQSLVLK